MADLRIQLEAERAEARRAKMEASSTIKQYEALVQRLRREADASEAYVQCALRACISGCQASAAAGSKQAPVCQPYKHKPAPYECAHRQRNWGLRPQFYGTMQR